jgi:hypothetical protein
MGTFILASTILTPLNLAFPAYRLQSSKYSIFMYAIDAFYIVDIFISFISAYEGHNKNLHTDFKEIAKNYNGTWLPVDVLSIIPFDLIFIYSILL